MKKIMLFVAGFVLSSAMFISCSIMRSMKEVEKDGFICSKYELPVNSMENEDVLAMITNYYQKQYALLDTTFRKIKLGLDPKCPEDSRAVFFTLDVLKKLIYFTEKASKGFTASEKENLGLNIYYASYPRNIDNGHDKIKNGINYTNRHTLIFIPSIYNSGNGTAKDIDLFANLSGKFITTPSYITEDFFKKSKLIACVGDNQKEVAGSTSKLNLPGNSIISTMSSQNDGTATPPPPRVTSNPILDITTKPQ